MNVKNAVLLFLAVCVVLAILLLFGAVTPIVSGVIFAVALAIFGGASRGFRKKTPEERK